MLDAQYAAVAPPAAIRREDYRPPDWLVPRIALEFDLDPKRTLVKATLEVERSGAHGRPPRLDGDGLRLNRHAVNGEPADPVYENDQLTIPIAEPGAKVETVVEI